MAVTTLEGVCSVIGGVDSHGEFHVAAAVDRAGAVLGTATFDASGPGYSELLRWLRAFGIPERVGVEGTGAYGAGLTRFLQRCGVQVVEIDRPNRQARRRQGKSDPLDAIQAARTALSGQAMPAKARDGNVEALRVLLVARRSATQARMKALVQMRHLVYTAPDELSASLRGLATTQLLRRASRLTVRSEADAVTTATRSALRALARRALALEEQIEELDELVGPLVRTVAPNLLELTGVGPLIAATLLVVAGDNPERLRSEAAWAHLCGVAPLPASSGKVIRHRLDPGGNRQANAALWRIVMVRLAHDATTRAYMERRTNEGRSKKEVLRSLKRYVARQVYRQLPTV